jgi:hypothetical protein
MGHALSIVGAPAENGAAISDAIEADRDVPRGRR